MGKDGFGFSLMHIAVKTQASGTPKCPIYGQLIRKIPPLSPPCLPCSFLAVSGKKDTKGVWSPLYEDICLERQNA